MKKIYVLLTRFPDNGAKILEIITGCFYSHASIGLGEDMNTFYSFVVKGFIVEKITRYIKPERKPYPCQLYEMEVSEQDYKTVRRILKFYVNYRDKMSYTKMGLVMSVLKIPFKKKYAYFCSQFVAEVLHRAGVVIIRNPTNFYMPGDFSKLKEMKLVFEGNLQNMINHFEIQPCLL